MKQFTPEQAALIEIESRILGVAKKLQSTGGGPEWAISTQEQINTPGWSPTLMDQLVSLKEQQNQMLAAMGKAPVGDLTILPPGTTFGSPQRKSESSSESSTTPLLLAAGAALLFFALRRR